MWKKLELRQTSGSGWKHLCSPQPAGKPWGWPWGRDRAGLALRPTAKTSFAKRRLRASGSWGKLAQGRAGSAGACASLPGSAGARCSQHRQGTGRASPAKATSRAIPSPAIPRALPSLPVPAASPPSCLGSGHREQLRHPRPANAARRGGEESQARQGQGKGLRPWRRHEGVSQTLEQALPAGGEGSALAGCLPPAPHRLPLPQLGKAKGAEPDPPALPGPPARS